MKLREVREQIGEVERLLAERREKKKMLEESYMRNPGSVEGSRIVSLEREIQLLETRLVELQKCESDLTKQYRDSKVEIEKKLTKLYNEITPLATKFFEDAEALRKLVDNLAEKIRIFEHEFDHYSEVCRELDERVEYFNVNSWPRPAYLEKIKRVIMLPEIQRKFAELFSLNHGGWKHGR